MNHRLRKLGVLEMVVREPERARTYESSDGHTSIQKVAEAAFLGASWQMCEVHVARAVLRNIPRKHQNEVAENLREAYGDEQKLQELADDLSARRYRKTANTIEIFLPGLMSYTTFPKNQWRRIRTTNMLERVKLFDEVDRYAYQVYQCYYSY